jgi:hypothetical protein
MSSLPKGESNVHKVGCTLANRVVERISIIKDHLRGRDWIEFVRGSLIQGEFLSLSFLAHFVLVLSFS